MINLLRRGYTPYTHLSTLGACSAPITVDVLLMRTAEEISLLKLACAAGDIETALSSGIFR